MLKEKIALSLDKILDLFRPGGRLCLILKDYESRKEQERMLGRVISCYNEGRIGLIEAATGTGKSLSYLVPAVLWALQNHEKTLISTKTINLQEQLILKDIPLVKKILGRDFKAVLVKGISNYLCLRKLHETSKEPSLFQENLEEITQLKEWSQETSTGTKSDLPFPLSVTSWEKVMAEAELCSGPRCPFYKDCFFFKARAEMKDASILVANHHILFADLAARKETDNWDSPQLMPYCSKVVIDEAHHIEDVALDFFAFRTSKLDIVKILGRLSVEGRDGKNEGKFSALGHLILHHFREKESEFASLFQLLFMELPQKKREVVLYLNEFFQTIHHFFSDMMGLKPPNEEEKKLRIFPHHLNSPFWREEVIPQEMLLSSVFQSFFQLFQSLETRLQELPSQKFQEESTSLREDIRALISKLGNEISHIHRFVSMDHSFERVRWMEIHQIKGLQNIYLIDAKIDVSKDFVETLFSKFSTVVLSSATLSSSQKFSWIRKKLGLTEDLLSELPVDEEIISSPFDFERQALLLIPTDLPPPEHPQFIQEASEKIWQAIQISNGSVFILFTSYQMLNSCYERLKERLEKHHFSTFKQGDDQRQRLLQNFQTTRRSVLFGSDSFWEGVDVKGDALKLVIIVKLPFAVPSEPLQQAKAEMIIKNGGAPFKELSLPQAIIKFKQGFGRLIRHKQDRGCVLCLDTRLSKSYGIHFLKSLPPVRTLFEKSDILFKEMVKFFIQNSR